MSTLPEGWRWEYDDKDDATAEFRLHTGLGDYVVSFDDASFGDVKVTLERPEEEYDEDLDDEIFDVAELSLYRFAFPYGEVARAYLHAYVEWEARQEAQRRGIKVEVTA